MNNINYNVELANYSVTARVLYKEHFGKLPSAALLLKLKKQDGLELLEKLRTEKDYANLIYLNSSSIDTAEMSLAYFYINKKEDWLVEVYESGGRYLSNDDYPDDYSSDVEDNESIITIFYDLDKGFAMQDSLVEKRYEYVKNLGHSNTVNLVSQGRNGLEIIKLKTSKFKDRFSIDHYNESFVNAAEVIKKSVNSPTSGIILLHGDAGTGKTSFIKHLLSIATRPIFYIPPDMIQALASPEFNKFLTKKLNNSILVIEDAENVIKERESGGNQAVSNLLNLSDGILGDLLNITIVCTFNTPKEYVDKALMRPGRLIAEYNFTKLTKEKTNVLVQKLVKEGKLDVKHTNVDYPSKSLAEIFNMDSMPEKSADVERRVGFT